jgi:glycosyltransferase involved in cell wall biosynthesis
VLITIVTPTYNRAATIQDTIDSILAQDHAEVEHIVIDGASTDGTAEIVRDYGDLIRQFVSEPDGGVFDAMNKGIARASGEVVGILNSDDFYTHPQVLSKVAQAFREHAVDSVYGDLQYVDPQQTHKVIRHWRAGHYRHGNFLYGWMPPHPTFFVRREVYERYGHFDTSFRTAADYELMLRFLYKHRLRVAYIPEVLVRMRAGGISNAGLRSRWHANREDSRAWRKNGLRPKLYTTLLKPIRKLGQFL